jgi:hypothetical protein
MFVAWAGRGAPTGQDLVGPRAGPVELARAMPKGYAPPVRLDAPISRASGAQGLSPPAAATISLAP